MRIVIALGGNALLRRDDPMTTDVQRRNIRIAVQAIAPLAAAQQPDRPHRAVHLDHDDAERPGI